MYITIDRFEGDFAAVETESGKIYNIPRALVPDAAEGDVVEISVNKAQTKKQLDEVQELVDELFKD